MDSVWQYTAVVGEVQDSEFSKMEQTIQHVGDSLVVFGTDFGSGVEQVDPYLLEAFFKAYVHIEQAELTVRNIAEADARVQSPFSPRRDVPIYFAKKLVPMLDELKKGFRKLIVEMNKKVE